MDLKRVDRVFRVLPTEERYYEQFHELAAAVVEGCELLCRFFSEENDPVATVAAAKAAQRRGDDVTREIDAMLGRSFVTPIDREDIHGLAVALDDVLEHAHAAASYCEATGLSPADEHMKALAAALLGCARELSGAVEHLEDRDGIGDHCAAVYRLSGEAEGRMTAALRSLFAGSPDPLRVIRLKDVYERVAHGIDRCSDAAIVLEAIVRKSS